MAFRALSRLALLALPIGLACALPSPVAANEICAAEIQPMMRRHQEVMQATQRAMPRGQPRTFEAARANAQRACGALGNAQASFVRLQTWVTANREFCSLPDQMVNDVARGLANVRRSRTQACNAVGQIDRQRRQAEARAAQGGDSNPFAPNAARRPQLDLRTPGAL